MKCEEIAKKLTAYALDEVDSTERGEIERHVLQCDACRQRKDELASTVHILSQAPEIPTSVDRRERTIQAMSETASATSPKGRNRYLSPLRHPLTLVAAAAILAVALLPFVGFYNRQSPLTMSVGSVKGRAYIQMRNSSMWENVVPKTVVSEGDWITTEMDSLVTIVIDPSIRGNSGMLTLNGNTSIKIGLTNPQNGMRTIIIDKGQLYGNITAQEGVAYTIVNTNNDVVIVSHGEFEAGITYTISAGSSIADRQGTTLKKGLISMPNEKVSAVASYIGKASRKSIEVPAGVTAEKRMTFDSDETAPEKLFRDFESALEKEGLAIVRSTGRHDYRILPYTKGNGNWTIARRMYARVKEGELSLRGTKGEVMIAAGEEGNIDSDGHPFHKKMASPVVAVWREQSQATGMFANNRIPIPSMEIQYIGQADDGKPIVRYKLNAAELVANFGDTQAEIIIPAFSGEAMKLEGNGEEIVLPLRVRLAISK